MTQQETRPGQRPLVRDDVVEEGLPCFVYHPDAGGQCARTATMKVYDLAFCEIHGPEVKAGALTELCDDASNFLARLDNPHVRQPNPVALRALRENVSALTSATQKHEDMRDEANRRAHPDIPRDVREKVRQWQLDEGPDALPVSDILLDWISLVHKLMRLSYEKDAPWLVETLEAERESLAAQLAAAVALEEEGETANTR